MKSQTVSGKNKYELKTAQRQAFLQIFNMHAKDGKIGVQELKTIFKRVGYFISEEHFKDICEKAFEFHNEISFQEFMEVFRIKDSPYSLTDIRNAFKLVAGEQDEFIPLDLFYEIFRKSGIERERVDDLMIVLGEYVDEQKKVFNYRLFLQQLKKE